MPEISQSVSPVSPSSRPLVTFPDLATLRRRGTVKWTRFDDDVLPLWVAESDADTCPAILRALHDAINREYLGYPGMSRSGSSQLARSASAFQREVLGWDVDPSWVTPAPDVVLGLRAALDLLVAEGPIVLTPPVYPPFFEVVAHCGREIVEVPMVWRPREQSDADDISSGDTTSRWGLDLEGIDAAFAAGAAGILLCSPHNPLGSIHPPEDLRALAESAHRHGARILSDEIHAPLVLPRKDAADATPRHVPTASVSDVAAEVTVTVTAATKAWNFAGLKSAQIIASSAADRRRLTQASHLHTSGATTLGEVATIAAYDEGREWVAALCEHVAGQRDHLAARLGEVMPGARWVPPEASYLAWLDCRDVEFPQENGPRRRGREVPGGFPAAFFRSTARVAFNPGPDFGIPGAHHVRLNLATSREVLDAALDRVGAALAAAPRRAPEA